jgi:chromosome segregation ATPase
MRTYIPAAIEEEVYDAVSDLMDDKEYVLRKLEEHFAQKRKELSRTGADAVTLTRRIADLDRRRDGYWELAADGDMPRETMRRKVAEIEQEREHVERALERVIHRDEELDRLTETEREMRKRIEATENNLEDMTPEKRRSLYQDLRLRVEVDEDKHPYISGLFPTRVAGITATLVRTPDQRGYLYEHVSNKETSYT